MNTFFIDNHGCAKNQVDAEEMAASLRRQDYQQVTRGDDADLIIVNSCGFIEAAKAESIEAVLAIRAAWPGKKILLAGCLAQRYPDQLYGDLPEADGIFGNNDLSQVGSIAADVLADRRSRLVPARRAFQPGPRDRLYGYPGMAYLKIAEGCSNNCAFCAIPLIRGPVSSRSVADIVAEFQDLLARGVYEICLIGQDLGSFGRDTAGRQLLPELLQALSALPGDFRVRLLYIHPDNFPLAILDICAADRRILSYFDLPFQHAAEPVLRAMNRKGNAAGYLELLATIRAQLPDATIRTTFLVGFPGESEADFQQLLDFQQAAKPDWLGCFAYSREEDTTAYRLKSRVAKAIALKRQHQVEEAQIAITAAALQTRVGSVRHVLVEERIDGEDLAIGRADLNAPDVDGAIVVVGGSLQAGDRLEVRISAVRGVDLEAVPLPAAPK